MTDFLQPRLTPEEICQISSLGLAHIGDAVYELMARTYICQNGSLTAKSMHSAAVNMVSAPAQAKAADLIFDALDESERAVFLRGRNTRFRNIAKNADCDTYHRATAFEALVGYLYLRGDKARLNEFFKIITARADTPESPE